MTSEDKISNSENNKENIRVGDIFIIEDLCRDIHNTVIILKKGFINAYCYCFINKSNKLNINKYNYKYFSISYLNKTGRYEKENEYYNLNIIKL